MRTKREIREYLWLIPYFICYILWATYYKVCPIFYDMYVMKTDYLVRNSTFIGVMKAVLKTGGCWKNARYLTNVINIYMVSYDGITDFIMPFVFIFTIFFATTVIKKEHKCIPVLMGASLFFCVSDGIVQECYSYSYVLYLFPIVFMTGFIYVTSIYESNENLFNTRAKQLLYLLLVYCNACFLESISCIFTVVMVGIFIDDYYIKKRKNRLILIAATISLAQTLFMNLYLIIKGTRPLTEEGIGFFEIFTSNFRVIILETWISNPVIICIILLTLAVAVRNRRSFMYADLILLGGYIIWMTLIYSNGGFDTASNVTERNVAVSYVPAGAWPLWMVLYIGINLFILYQLLLINGYMALAFFCGAGSTAPVLLTPNTGWRISSFYVFMMIVVVIMLLQNESLVTGKKLLISALTVAMLGIGLYRHIPRIIRMNETWSVISERIEETKIAQQNGKWDVDKDVLTLPVYDRRDVSSQGVIDKSRYYMWNFAYAYGLDKDTQIVNEY